MTFSLWIKTLYKSAYSHPTTPTTLKTITNPTLVHVVRAFRIKHDTRAQIKYVCPTDYTRSVVALITAVDPMATRIRVHLGHPRHGKEQ